MPPVGKPDQLLAGRARQIVKLLRVRRGGIQILTAMEHQKRNSYLPDDINRSIFHGVPRVVAHPAVYQPQRKADGLFLFDHMIFYRFAEIGEHSLGDDRVDARGAVGGMQRQHSRCRANADAVENEMLNVIGLLHVLDPCDGVLAFLKADGVELPVAQTVTARINDEDVAIVICVGDRKIVAVYQAFGSAGQDHGTTILAKIVVFAVKVQAVVDDM